jgi:hypothetical protein
MRASPLIERPTYVGFDDEQIFAERNPRGLDEEPVDVVA